MKYIIVTGGVISSIGKGITASSVAYLLQSSGFKVNIIKIDPYLNIDAGTMSPFEHGECYVLDDGSETDLDLGNYERFLNTNLTSHNIITTGKVYQSVISKERTGYYLGKTVQVVPHIIDEIIHFIHQAGQHEICIIELGGTIGDIESQPFIEAIRQLKYNDDDTSNFCFIHVGLVPCIGDKLEPKTKPIQNSVKSLRNYGINPDIICLRCQNDIDTNTKNKISMFCQVKPECIIVNKNVPNIYHVPILFNQQNMVEIILKKLNLQTNLSPKIEIFNHITNFLSENKKPHLIGIVGKYTDIDDTYLSIVRALEHASYYTRRRFKICWIDSDDNDISSVVSKLDGVIIPGGFGERGIIGMIKCIQFCRENNIPILGICLGMQLMVIEICQNILKINTNSEEFDSQMPNPCIIFMPETSKNIMGGTMRLGNKTTIVKPDSLAYRLYNSQEIYERHRHRYEVNLQYQEQIEKEGFIFSGMNEIKTRMEILESTNHDYFLGCQFHPEFKSRMETPHPLFIGFLNSMSILDL